MRAARKGDTGALWADRLGLGRGHALGRAAVDRVFDANPPAWSAVGSGQQPSNAPDPNWGEVVRILLDAGACTEGIVLEAGEVSQPSPEVASLLLARGAPSR